MNLYDPNDATILRQLATIPATSDPVVSLYARASADCEIDWSPIDHRLKMLRETLTSWERASYDEAVSAAKKAAALLALLGVRNIAVFARGGELPFSYSFEGADGQEAMSIQLDTVPCLWPLLHADKTTEQVILVHLDHYAARIEEWRIAPHSDSWFTDQHLDPSSVASRFGRECYQHHRREQSPASLQEKIKLLRETIDPESSSKIIITGKAPMVQRLMSALPADLKAVAHRLLVDNEDAALSAIIHAEGFRFSVENQKWPGVTQLRKAIWRDALGVAGFKETSAAIGKLSLDTILIAKEQSITAAGRKLMKDAMQHNVGIKVIDDSHTLLAIGGVGALLQRLPTTKETEKLAETVSALTTLAFCPSIL